MKSGRIGILAVLFVMVFFGISHSGTTGKIAGRVIDANTKLPLIGANVIITAKWIDGQEVEMSRQLGAAADREGNYFVLGIPPGVYSVTVRYMGYQRLKQTQIKVQIDKTTRVDFALSEEVVEGEKVVVTAFRPHEVEVDQTSSKQTYTVAEVAEAAGVSDVSEIVDLQADVVDNHFRGGRTAESLYLINGANIVNPIDNTSSFKPLTAALEEVEVYTSGFTAEYGNAQSGVVNMVSKEGGDKWLTHIETSSSTGGYKTWGGSLFSEENLPFYDFLNVPEEWLKNYAGEDETQLQNFDQFIPDNASWEDSLRAALMARNNWLQMVWDVGLEYGRRPDIRIDFSIGGPVSEKIRLFMAGRHESIQPIAPVPHANLERQLISNLSFQLSNNHKLRLSYNYFYSFINEFSTGAFLRWTFDREFRVPKSTETVHQAGLNWNTIINSSSFAELDINYLSTKSSLIPEFLQFGTYRKEDSLAAYNRDFADWYITAPDGHRVNEVYTNLREHEHSETVTLKGYYLNQITRNNLLKTGFQLYAYNLNVQNYKDFNTIPESQIEDYTVYPYEGAVYIQDKLEFQGLIANIGLRYDFYNFNYTYYSDEYSPLRNPNYNPDDPDSGNRIDRDFALTEKTKPFSKFQPRVGISFPISVFSVVYLNYGIFVQRPPFNRILKSQITGAGQIIELGNPRLRPEQTTAYDIGLVQALPFGFKLELSAYYKDVQDLIQQAIYYDDRFIPYYTFTNLDYADIKGFHVNLEKSTGNWSVMLRYNFQEATGKASTPFDNPIGFYEVAAEDQERVDLPDPRDITLDFNRKHRLVGHVRYQTSRSFGPSIAGFRPLAGLALSATLKYMSGRPYTWDPEGTGLRFNRVTPSETDLRCRIQKRFDFGTSRLTVYLEGYNVLNQKQYDYYIFSNPEEVDRVQAGGPESTEFLNVDDVSPYLTSRTVQVIRNTPRMFRLGLIMNF